MKLEINWEMLIVATRRLLVWVTFSIMHTQYKYKQNVVFRVKYSLELNKPCMRNLCETIQRFMKSADSVGMRAILIPFILSHTNFFQSQWRHYLCILLQELRCILVGATVQEKAIRAKVLIDSHAHVLLWIHEQQEAWIHEQQEGLLRLYLLIVPSGHL